MRHLRKALHTFVLSQQFLLVLMPQDGRSKICKAIEQLVIFRAESFI
jgi:hypothetical protein